jgi:hypothetical protein
VRVAEALVFILLLALIAWATIRAVSGAERTRRLRSARWSPAVHSLPSGGYQVVVECEGEVRQVVRELPAGMPAEEFSSELAEARAQAEEHAAALNAARR